MFVDIFNTDNKYDIVYTDPPWNLGKGGKKKSRPNTSGGNLDYPTMELEDIKVLHRDFLSKNTNEKHNVFCWTTERFLADTEKMFQDLGYKLHIRMIYSKCGMGMASAFTVRFSHEYLLWFYPAGKMYKNSADTRGKYSSVLECKPTAHSRKPQAFRHMFLDMFPNASMIELFARQHADGWDCWGNEVWA